MNKKQEIYQLTGNILRLCADSNLQEGCIISRIKIKDVSSFALFSDFEYFDLDSGQCSSQDSGIADHLLTGILNHMDRAYVSVEMSVKGALGRGSDFEFNFYVDDKLKCIVQIDFDSFIGMSNNYFHKTAWQYTQQALALQEALKMEESLGKAQDSQVKKVKQL